MPLTYDELSRGNNNGYAPHKKLYFEHESLSTTVEVMSDMIDETIEDIVKNRGPIDEFVIGKTYAKTSSRQTFNPTNFKTWKLDGGVNGRWNSKYKPEGFDGLIVLRAFTKESLPAKTLKKTDGERVPLFNHQDYALAVEQQLIHRFAYEKMDPRLGNFSLSTGNVEKKGAKAYVIYMAFKLDREE